MESGDPQVLDPVNINAQGDDSRGKWIVIAVIISLVVAAVVIVRRRNGR